MMFKFQPTSWHYGWRSSRHTKSLRHAFWVYVFVSVKESVGVGEGGESEAKSVRCVLRCCTKSFTLASSKRVKLQPDAKTAQASHKSNTLADIDFAAGTHVNGIDGKHKATGRKLSRRHRSTELLLHMK